MELFFALISFMIFLSIIISKGYKKLVWVLLGIIFLDNGIIISNILFPINRLWICALIISIIIDTINKKNNFNDLKGIFREPYITAIIIPSIIFLVLSVFDSRNSFIKNEIRGFLYIIDRFSILLLAGYFINNIKEIYKIFKYFYYMMLVCAIYSIYVLFTLENPYSLIISKVYDINDISAHFIDRPRIAISSFITQPHKNAVFMVLALFIRFFLWVNKDSDWKFNFKQICFLLIIIFSQIVSNSRAASWGGIIAFIFFVVLHSFNKIQQIRLMAFSVIYFLLISLIVRIDLKKTHNLVSQYFSSKSSNNDEIEFCSTVYGSSLDMRLHQLKSCFELVKHNLWIGNGNRWLQENYGFNPLKEDFTIDNFYGFESIIFIILIEFGLIGILAYIIFFTGLTIYNLKITLTKKSNFKIWGILNISILIILSFVIIINGDPLIFSISLFFISLGIKAINILSIKKIKV